MVTFTPEQFRRIGCAIFEAAGASPANARRTVDSLISASLADHDSHGTLRLVQYIEAIEQGHIDAAAEPKVIQDGPATALIDGNWTFGQVSAGLAMNLALEKARTQGIAMVGLIRSYHIGRLGEYSEQAAAAGMVGMVLAGGFGGTAGRSKAVAPYGGAAPVFSTNPISFGIPAGEQPPVIVDFATSAVAGGKISLARAKGEHLPPSSILDRHGRPTTDPEDFYNGGMSAGLRPGSTDSRRGRIPCHSPRTKSWGVSGSLIILEWNRWIRSSTLCDLERIGLERHAC